MVIYAKLRPSSSSLLFHIGCYLFLRGPTTTNIADIIESMIIEKKCYFYNLIWLICQEWWKKTSEIEMRQRIRPEGSSIFFCLLKNNYGHHYFIIIIISIMHIGFIIIIMFFLLLLLLFWNLVLCGLKAFFRLHFFSLSLSLSMAFW